MFGLARNENEVDLESLGVRLRKMNNQELQRLSWCYLDSTRKGFFDGANCSV